MKNSNFVWVSDYGTHVIHEAVRSLFPEGKLDGRTREAKRLKREQARCEIAMAGVIELAWVLDLDSPRDLFPE